MATNDPILGLRRNRPSFFDQVEQLPGGSEYARQVREQEYLAKRRRDIQALPEPVKAFQHGVRGLRSNIAAAQAIPDLITGDQQEAARDLSEAQRLQEEAEAYRPRISQFTDIKSIGDAAEFISNTIIGQSPILATMAVGAGAGTVAAQVGLRRAAFAAGEQASARALPMATRLAPATAKEAAGRVGARAAAQQIAKTTQRGALTGVVGTSGVLQAGENLGALAEEDISGREAAGLAVAGAVPQALLDVAPALFVLKKLGLAKAGERAIRRSLPREVLKAVGQGAAIEAPTEVVQQAIQRGLRAVVNDNIHVLDAEGIIELLNAGAAGFVAGAGLGAGSATIGAGLKRLARPRGKVEERFDEIEEDREASITGVRKSQSTGEATPEAIRKLLTRGSRPESPLNEGSPTHDPAFVDRAQEILLKYAKGGDKALTDLEKDFVVEVLRRHMEPPAANATFEYASPTNPVLSEEQVEEATAEATPEDETPDFDETTDPRAVQTREPASQEILGARRFVVDPDSGDTVPLDTPIGKQLHQTVALSNRLEEERGSGKRHETSSFEEKIQKRARRQAEIEGKDVSQLDVFGAHELEGQAAARLLRLKGSERARMEAARTGEDVNVVAQRIAEEKINEASEDKQAGLRRILEKDGSPLAFLDNYEFLAREESPLDEAPGFAPEVLRPKLKAVPKPGKPIQRGNIPVEYRGRPFTINLQDLIRDAMQSREIQSDQTLTLDQRVERALAEAIGTLAQTPGVNLSFDRISDDTVVFTGKNDGRPLEERQVTWGQMKARLPPALTPEEMTGGIEDIENTGVDESHFRRVPPEGETRGGVVAPRVEGIQSGGKENTGVQESPSPITPRKRVEESGITTREQARARKFARELTKQLDKLRDQYKTEKDKNKRAVIRGRGEAMREQLMRVQRVAEGGPAVEPFFRQETEQREELTDRRDTLDESIAYLDEKIRQVETQIKDPEAEKSESTQGLLFRLKVQRQQYLGMKEEETKPEIKQTRKSEGFFSKLANKIGEDKGLLRNTEALMNEWTDRMGLPRAQLSMSKNQVIRFIQNGIESLRSGLAANEEHAVMMAEIERLGKSEAVKRFERDIESNTPDTGIAGHADVVRYHRLLEESENIRTQQIMELQATINSILSDNTGGFQAQLSSGQLFIFINPNFSPEVVVSNLAHEVGHHIAETLEISKEQAVSLRESFVKFLADKQGVSVNDILADRATAAFLDLRFKDSVLTMLGQIPPNDANAGYWLSYEEWFADNVARWLTTNVKPLTSVDKYFHSLAQKLLDLVKAVMEKFGIQITPDKAVADLMDSIFDKSQQMKDGRDWLTASSEVRGQTFRQWANEHLDGFNPILMASAQIAPGSAQAHEMTMQFIKTLEKPELRILGRVFTSGPVRTQLLKLVPRGVATAIRNGDVEQAIAYGYQLWRTGQLTNLGPQTKTVFSGIKNAMGRYFGVLQRHELAGEILIKAQQGVLEARKNGAAVFDVEQLRFRNQKLVEKGAKAVVEMAEKLSGVFNVITVAQGRLYSKDIPSLVLMSNMFSVRTGERSQDPSLVEDKLRYMGQFGEELFAAYKHLDAEQRTKLLGYLQNPTGEAPPGAVEVRRVLNRMFQYTNERAGSGFVKETKDYFPWVFDMEGLQSRRAEFVALAGQAKFRERTIEALMMSLPQRIMRENPGMQYKAAETIAKNRLTDTTEEQLAGYLYDQIMDQYGYADNEPAPRGPVPFARHVNSRWLGYLFSEGNAQDREQLSSFFDKDLDKTLAVYTEQLVKRTEFVRRFGREAQGLDKIFEQARRQGATDRDIGLAKDFVAAMMGSYGLEMHPALNDVLKLKDRWFGGNWADMDPRTLRKYQGVMIAYQNLRLLGFATIASLSDVSGLLMRGDLSSAFEGFRTGIREAVNLAKDRRSAILDLARSMGTIERHAVQELLMQAYGNSYMPSMARKINDKFFTAIGLTYWTRLTRLMALSAGQRFIMNQVQKPNAQSPRFLAELNLEASDVKIENGELVITDKIKSALNRFVDEAIIRPNAAQRPLWGSHPDLAMVFHLKQFLFSMGDRILRRFAVEVGNGNYTPTIAAFTGYVGIAIAADLIREELRFDEEDPRKENWDFWAYLDSGADRAGLYGSGELLLQARDDRRYGGTGFEGFLGPTFTQSRQVGQAFVWGGRDEWRTVVDAIPVANLFLSKRLFKGGNDGEEAEEGFRG